MTFYFLDNYNLVLLRNLFDTLYFTLQSHDFSKKCISKHFKAFLVFLIILSFSKIVKKLTTILNTLVRKTAIRIRSITFYYLFGFEKTFFSFDGWIFDSRNFNAIDRDCREIIVYRFWLSFLFKNASTAGDSSISHPIIDISYSLRRSVSCWVITFDSSFLGPCLNIVSLRDYYRWSCLWMSSHFSKYIDRQNHISRAWISTHHCWFLENLSSWLWSIFTKFGSFLIIT